MTTSAPLLRGLAVLALLCLLPRASAFNLTLTGQITGGGGANGGQSIFTGGTWNFDRYNGPERITDVMVIVSMVTTGRVQELNIYNAPMRYDFAAAEIFEVVAGGQSAQGSGGISSGPRILAPLSSMSLPFTFAQDFVLRFGPTEVSAFVGNGQGAIYAQARTMFASYYGGGEASTRTNITVLFNVPDHGPGAASGTCAMIGLALVHGIHRRRKAPR